MQLNRPYSKALSTPNANEFRKKTGKIKQHDRRFNFLTKARLPRSKPHYDMAVKYVRILVNATRYNTSIVFALDAFSEYRIEVLFWVYGIKGGALNLSKNSKKAPQLPLATVVFGVFNTIQERLVTIHEKTMQTFENSARKLFNKRRLTVKQRNQRAQQMFVILKRKLQQYETTVRKTKGILRSALSFL